MLDLGWMYLSTTRAQKAVDAAALAGVVNLPGFIAQANQDAADAARANGYDPGGADTLTVTPLADNKLHAELRTSIEPFFLKVLGFDQFNITREATSEYIKPVPLGNPNNCFGCPSVGDSWAAVSSEFIHKEHGDPYSTQCRVPAGPGSCSSGNSDYNRGGAYSGYYYGIEVMSGSSGLLVELFDAGFHARPQDEGTGDFALSGDAGPTTNYTLHMVDTTPLDPTDNPAISGCSVVICPGHRASGPMGDPVLSERVDHPRHLRPSCRHLRARDGPATIIRSGPTLRSQPRVFGINDMSIWSNDLVSSSTLYLAEIEDIHAGKKLELQFYDPGDADADSWMSVISPTGGIPNCSWTVWNHNLTSQTKPPGSGPCTWQTTDTSDPDGDGDRRNYNEQWIVATIDLPDDPADMCGADCFWKMDLDLSLPTERTTWRARVIGNPVRLVPPETVP